MQASEVSEINLSTPLTAVGRVFVGDYAKSQEYIIEIQGLLNKKSIPFIPNQVMGVYYDNPLEKKPEELRSFQGVFLTTNSGIENIDATITKLSLQGKYLHVKISGDPMQSIFDGYNALFSHILNQKVNLKSNTGYQISTYEDGMITTEIYMEIL